MAKLVDTDAGQDVATGADEHTADAHGDERALGERLHEVEQRYPDLGIMTWPVAREDGAAGVRSYPVILRGEGGDRSIPVCDHRHVDDVAGALECLEREAARRDDLRDDLMGRPRSTDVPQ